MIRSLAIVGMAAFASFLAGYGLARLGARSVDCTCGWDDRDPDCAYPHGNVAYVDQPNAAWSRPLERRMLRDLIQEAGA